MKQRAGVHVSLAGMGRWLGPCALATGLLVSSAAHAEDLRARRSVVVIAPAASTCVLADPLLVGIMNAGPYFASLVPANSVPETIPATTFQVEGTPAALHLRAWGLGWPMGARKARPEVDQVIGAQSCETMTEAVVAQIVSLLAPDDGGFDELLVPEPSSESTSTFDPQALERVLDDARRQLAVHPRLSAGVFVTPLGLELAVQDERARCRRATWLSTSSGAPELGMSVAELTSAVDACVAALPPDEPRRATYEPPRDRGAFHLAVLTGSLTATLGLINGFLIDDGSNTTATLVYGVAPPVLGGLGSYLVSERWREPVVLTGYWLGVAGTSMIVATESGARKTLLVGGALAAGSVTSAALATVNGLIGEPSDRIAAWAVATPAVVGAGLGIASLAIDGRGRHSGSLAALGGAAASLPALWLAGVAVVDNLSQDPPLDVAITVEHDGSPGLRVSGEF